MPKTVERQIVLPWTQVVKISYNSMKVRLFRTLITTLTLTLAIAFVSFTWSGYEILNSIWPHADTSLRESILAKGYELVGGQFGTGPKDRWLAILSLVVCVVGIVNAQLMAVTERFREIGTFKCLGALDSFVVRIFVLESMYQGLLGGVSGAVVGIIVATCSFLIQVGWSAIRYWPFLDMMATLIWASLTAVLLSLLGVIYPALVASRMQPAIALRNEE